ncbi:MAG: nuclear transport factor 2 family protein [Desulfotignum sp.]
MEPLQQFIKTFNRLDKNNLALLDQIYHHEIHFEDPAHTLDGIDSLKQYFSVLYENIQSIHFDFNTHLQSGSQAFMTWTMHYSHPRLAKGRPITVDGCSCLFFAPDGRVIDHRDYFDLGAMVYEHIPVLGNIIQTIKKRLGS